MRKSLFLLMLVLSAQAFGQALVTQFDKKVIYPDSLNLPRNTSAMTVITSLPELLQRPGDYILNNYDVQVDGMTIGSAVDVALSQLQVMDIDFIEVCESPVTSHFKNGQGGSINFVLRSKGGEKGKPWGSVGVLATSDVDVAPQFNLAYRKGRFLVRGLLLGEMYDASSESQTLVYSNGELRSHSFTETDVKFQTELARAYMQYDLSSRDKLKLNLSEIYTHQDIHTVTDHRQERAMPQRSKQTDLHGFLSYERVASRYKLTTELGYKYTPRNEEFNVGSVYMYSGDATMHALSGKVEEVTKLFSREGGHGRIYSGELTLGGNFNANMGDETASVQDRLQTVENGMRRTPKNNTLHIMPYLIYTGKMGPLSIQAVAEMQHFQYKVETMETPYTSVHNDFTGKLMAEWHIQGDRSLRFMLDRKLERPSAAQIYPYLNYEPKRMEYVKGNPELRPQMIHEVSLDYLDTYRWEEERRLTLNAGIGYNCATDVIDGYYPVKESQPGMMGQALKYYSYHNSSNSHVANANLMALYSSPTFSISLTGNVYHKDLNLEAGHDHYTYYNLAIHPYFNLNNGWSGGVRLAYYSRIAQAEGSLGDGAVAQMTVGKAWKRCFVFLTENVTLNKHSKDILHAGTTRTEKSYLIAANVVGLGLRYSF